MKIAGMVKSSLCDYPGLISCVVFTPGCGYDCFYCHNRPLIEPPFGGEMIAEEEVFSFLKSRVGLIDAVVISGGEPTLQEGLMDFMGRAGGLGFKIKLDTNGQNPDVVRRVQREGLAHYFAVDYKAPKSRYGEFCGPSGDAALVLQTIEELLSSGADFEVRTTVAPGLDTADLVTMARELPVVPRWLITPCRRPQGLSPRHEELFSRRALSTGELYEAARLMKEHQPGARLR